MYQGFKSEAAARAFVEAHREEPGGEGAAAASAAAAVSSGSAADVVLSGVVPLEQRLAEAGGDGQSLRNSNNKIEKGGGLGGFVDALATWLLGMGLGAQLEAAQNAMGSTADGLDTVAALFTWKDVHTSRNVCAGLFVSGAFLYLFPTRWLLVCVTVWLMLSSTMLYGVVVRALAGLSGLLARSPNADTMVKDGQIRGLLKVRVRGGGGGAQGESAGGGRRFVAKKKAQ